MNNLSLNFKEGFKYLIPLSVRKGRMVDWMGAALKPLQTLNGTFVAKASAIRYDLRFNGQVMYLERRLNDQYDPTNRAIYIDDPSGAYVFSFYVFNMIESQPTATVWNISEAKPPQQYLRNLVELIVGFGDFVVFVPTAINTSNNQIGMRAIINKYRAAGKQYSFSSI